MTIGRGAKNEENKGNLFSKILISNLSQIKSDGGVQESWKSLGLGHNFRLMTVSVSVSILRLEKKSQSQSWSWESGKKSRSQSRSWDYKKKVSDLVSKLRLNKRKSRDCKPSLTDLCMQVCKCKGMSVCNYARIKVYVMFVCNYTST